MIKLISVNRPVGKDANSNAWNTFVKNVGDPAWDLAKERTWRHIPDMKWLIKSFLITQHRK